MIEMETVARQFLRAVRGERSQVAFSRRLGYRGNPIADWEAGRRSPTAAEALRACTRAGIDIQDAFGRFQPAIVPSLGAADDAGVARWLDALRGNSAVVQVAATAGLSRFAVARFLKGQARPKLPEFFALVEALSARLSDLVFALLPTGQIPALAKRHAALEASRRLAFEEPWTEAVLRVIETAAYRALPAHKPGALAAWLGFSPEDEARCLSKLEAAGILAWDGARYTHAGPLTVDTRASPEATRRLKAHWSRVALSRLETPRDAEDLCSYNVFSVSHADLAKIRERHRAYFREVRAIVAASEPAEVVALLHLQLLRFF